MGYNTNKAAAPPAPSAPTAPSAPNSTAIMEALANLARQNATVPPSNPPVQAQNPALSVLSSLQNVASQYKLPAPPMNQFQQPPYSMPPILQQTNTATPVPPFSYPPQPPVQQPQVQPVGMPFLGALAQPPAAAPLDPQTQQQVMLIKALHSQGIPYDKIPGVIAALKSGQNGAALAALAAPAAPAAPATAPAQNYYATGQGWGGPVQPNDSHDQHRYNDGTRSPNRYQGRSRSRSPGRRWDSRGSSRGGRDNGSDYGRQDDRDSRGRGSDYRQRSPVSRNGGNSGHSRSPQHNPSEKWIQYDKSMPKGHIKVLSRTLFVGGVMYVFPRKQILALCRRRND